MAKKPDKLLFSITSEQRRQALRTFHKEGRVTCPHCGGADVVEVDMFFQGHSVVVHFACHNPACEKWFLAGYALDDFGPPQELDDLWREIIAKVRLRHPGI